MYVHFIYSQICILLQFVRIIKSDTLFIIIILTCVCVLTGACSTEYRETPCTYFMIPSVIVRYCNCKTLLVINQIMRVNHWVWRTQGVRRSTLINVSI